MFHQRTQSMHIEDLVIHSFTIIEKWTSKKALLNRSHSSELTNPKITFKKNYYACKKEIQTFYH